MIRILILCTGNSARSIMAEALINTAGEGRLCAVSAGSHPKAAPHGAALSLLGDRGHTTSGLSSKSWDQFAAPDAEPIDLVITVCDNAAGELCPIFPGPAVKAHWGIADPASVEGAGQRAAFEQAYAELDARITALLALPLETMAAAELRAAVNAIGTMPGATHV